MPLDLSNVFFITTANQLEPVPGPLRDRMEVIELSGYTEEEKLEIAKRYLVPRQIERNGLTPGKIDFTDEALREIVEGYTREAGVRNLERQIDAICRKVAREFAEGTRTRKRVIRGRTVKELLGKRRHVPDVKRRTGEPGVATGLAWTPVGLDEFPPNLLKEIELIFVDTIDKVLREALEPEPARVRRIDGRPSRERAAARAG